MRSRPKKQSNIKIKYTTTATNTDGRQRECETEQQEPWETQQPRRPNHSSIQSTSQSSFSAAYFCLCSTFCFLAVFECIISELTPNAMLGPHGLVPPERGVHTLHRHLIAQITLECTIAMVAMLIAKTKPVVT